MFFQTYQLRASVSSWCCHIKPCKASLPASQAKVHSWQHLLEVVICLGCASACGKLRQVEGRFTLYFNLSTQTLRSPYFLGMCHGIQSKSPETCLWLTVPEPVHMSATKESKLHPDYTQTSRHWFRWETDLYNKEHLLTLSGKPAIESPVIIYLKQNKKMSLMQTSFW